MVGSKDISKPKRNAPTPSRDLSRSFTAILADLLNDLAPSKNRVLTGLHPMWFFIFFISKTNMMAKTSPIEPPLPSDEMDPGNGNDQPSPVAYLSISPGKDIPLSAEISSCLSAIQEQFPKMPLWLLAHDGDSGDLSQLDERVWEAFYDAKAGLNENEPIVLLCISPGGDAESAYRIARMIQRKCGSFKIIVPTQAKSAATLLALGASEIIMGRDGDLGPLDVQIGDMNEERFYSGLDEVQAIEGLFQFATNQIAMTTFYWATALRKKTPIIFPSVIDYVTGMMRPLMEKIDTVHYMSLSRKLKIAEEYAVRLLADKYGEATAKSIANKFVRNYPYHGFIIDRHEGENIGLKNIKDLALDLQQQCDLLIKLTSNCSFALLGKFSR